MEHLTTIPEDGNFRMNSLEYISGSNTIIMTTINNSLTHGVFRTWVSKDDGETWTQIDEGTNVLFMDLSARLLVGWSTTNANGPSYLYKYIGSFFDRFA
ncbi:MAG: hypothetical protein IPK25_16385 [Saprospiraceae bacterium]|nr:hypothetical protein [Saprospiraceae bacterium]